MLNQSVEAQCEHKQEDLELKPLGGHRMNRGRQLLLDVRSSGLNPLAVGVLQILHVGRHCPLRVLLAQRQEVNLCGLSQEVFEVVVIVGFIPVDNGLFGQVKVKSLQGLRVVFGAWSEKGLNRMALGSYDKVDSQPVEKSAFTGDVAAICAACGLQW